MIEKGRISALQMWVMLYPTVMATDIITVPSISIKYAGRDLWLSTILASLVGFLVVYVIDRLNKLYPEQTFFQYCEHILGVLPGKMLGLIYLSYFLYAEGIILREYAEFVIGSFLSQTPFLVVVGSLVFVCACAVRGGVEVVGRSAQLFVGLFILPFFLMVLLLLPDLHVRNMFPILAHGIMPTIKGAFVSQSWMGQIFLGAFFLPYVVDRANGKKWGMITVFFIMLNLLMANLTVLFLFGQEVTSMLTYPVMDAARYVSLADFIEHLESIVMAVWVAGVFVKVCVYYYALVLGTAQWIKLSDYRPLVLPFGFLMILFTFWIVPSHQKLGELITKVKIFEVTLLFVVIPVLLLPVAVLRKRKQEKGGQAN
ncbi:germination protein [Collibacillus ludicampi]|uniref:Germination protein n=1 Tax=Collibacillus ludicampi TaxID=2771369 RepID=A0AAV4LB42_9BACL|nr:endospore germination permease [Collibacillus ludicampi]GIM45010.1 germination protein [Collibacillus ludicampi]